MNTLDQCTPAQQENLILDLVNTSNVTLVREKNVWKGLCPFHSDSNYSLIINPDQNHWQCVGDCQTGGSVVEWVMKAEGVSKSHAIELLQNKQPLSRITTDTPIQHSSVRRLDAPFSTEDNDQEILRRVVNYYHETLLQSPKALNYLQHHCIDSGDVVEQFKLGFSNRTLGYRLPEKNRKDGAAIRGRLQQLGILKPSGHELFHGSIVVPIIEDGVIKQIYGRKITKKLRPGTPLHTWLPCHETGFFNHKAIQTCEELIFCPSIIDALTFWCAGYKNVTCAYSEEHAHG